jgi:hypothetical protein
VRSFLSSFTVVAVLVFSGARVASAQEAAARNTITVSAGALNFDLAGTGTTVGVAVRGTRALTPHLALETGVLFARPDLQGGGRATLLAPEVHLQYHWRFGSIAPYAGGGIGFGHQSRRGSNVTDLALSTAGGSAPTSPTDWPCSASSVFAGSSAISPAAQLKSWVVCHLRLGDR